MSILDPAIIYHDLTTDLVTFGAILADRHLAFDEFVSTHQETIRQHYAKGGGYTLDQETARQAAAVLLGYLTSTIPVSRGSETFGSLSIAPCLTSDLANEHVRRDFG